MWSDPCYFSEHISHQIPLAHLALAKRASVLSCSLSLNNFPTCFPSISAEISPSQWVFLWIRYIKFYLPHPGWHHLALSRALFFSKAVITFWGTFHVFVIVLSVPPYLKVNSRKAEACLSCSLLYLQDLVQYLATDYEINEYLSFNIEFNFYHIVFVKSVLLQKWNCT